MKERSQSGGAAARGSPGSTGTPRSDQVALRRVTIFGRAAIKKLFLDPEQEQFAGSVDAVFDGLRDSQDPDCEHAFAIVADEKPVGFFILREKKALPDWAPHSVVTLHSFRVGSSFQGMGYGGAGVRLAVSWVRQNRPEITQLMLAVNTRNLPAKALYLKAGFVDEGAIFRGPIGDQHILALRIR